MTERFNYFRAHNHPLGWGVNDQKQNCTVAYGDKSICACIAHLLNGGTDISVLKNWADCQDSHIDSGATIHKYEH